MDKWISFYSMHFDNRQETIDFVQLLEALDLAAPNHRAKIMMHQIQRLVSLADDVQKITENCDALRLFFLIICAENISKLQANYLDDDKSKYYVQNFFKNFMDSKDKKLIESSFVDSTFKVLNLQEAIGFLYKVRCSVVHEGNYWSFQFAFPDISVICCDPPLTVGIRFEQLRAVVVRSGINAIRSLC
jgi:hypothetical protein